MRYEEFEERLKPYNCSMTTGSGIVSVRNRSGVTILTVSTRDRYIFDNKWPAFLKLLDSEEIVAGVIADLAYELAKTSLKNREPKEKLYLLRTANPLIEESGAYFTINITSGSMFFSSKHNVRGFKTIFTKSEMETMDTTGLKPIPYEEEN